VDLIDCDHRTPVAVDEGYPYIAIPQLKDGHIALDGARRISETDYLDWTRKLAPMADDVVVVRRCNSGQSAHIPAGLKCAIGQNLVVLRADGSKLHPQYLRWLVRGAEWWDEVGKYINVGAVFDSLRCRDIPNFVLPIPPLNEQGNIAATPRALDHRITLPRETNAALEAIAQALFNSWFVDFDPVRAKMEGRAPEGMDEATAALFPDGFEKSELRLVPSGWRAGILADLSHLNPESWTAKNQPATVAYVDLANTKDNEISSVADFTFDEAPSRARRVLRSGDTIIGTVRPGNRSFAFIHEPVCNLTGSTGFAVLRPSTTMNAEFVFLAATHDASIKQLAHVADGGAYPAVRPDVVSGLPCIVPDRPVLHKFHDAAQPLMVRVSQNQKHAQTLAALRDTLLPRLISGQLRLPEAQAEMKEAT